MRTITRFAVTAGLAGALALGTCPIAAFADTESDLAAARTRLEEIGSQCSTLEEQLSEQSQLLTETEYEISKTEDEISKKEDELAEAQTRLSGQVQDNYKDGGMTLVSVFTGVSDLNDLFSRVFYMDRVSEASNEVITEVKDIRDELTEKQDKLEAKQKEQESNVADMQGQIDDLNAQRQEASELVNSLDEKLQEELREEAERNAALQAAVEASEAEQLAGGSNDASASADAEAAEEVAEEPAQTENNSSNDNSSNNANETQQNNSSSNDNSNSNSGGNSGSGNSGSSSNSSSSSVTGGTTVSRAQSMVGVGVYVWGGCSAPNIFDCSGFVSWCLTGQFQRLGTTYTFLGWQQVSDPQPGDVCVNAGHCGIYVGNGQMIHAASPSEGVIQGPVQAGMIYVRY